MLSTSQSLKAKMSRGGGGGRIHVHQRDTDDTVPIIGADIAIKENHAAAAQTTQSKGMKDKTRKEHRNRHKHMMEFWREHYGRYFEQGTYILTDEQKADPTKYYFQNDRDLHYRGLNVKMVIAHCSNKKFKPNGKLIGPSDLSKYGDAIKWGATMAGEVLPTEFYVEFENFITSYKKEYSEAKKEGKVDEKAADPINAGLFTKILQWAVASLNIFVWVYALLMWHLMARSISISSLGLHNMKVGSGGDSLAFKFDNSKVAAEGGVNSAILAAEMEKLKTDMREMVGEILTQTPADSTAVLRRDQSEQVDPTIRIPGQTQFSYTDNNGITRGTCIPPTFEFPSEISRFEGWRKWLCGQTFVYEGVKWQLPPFRHLKGTAFAPDNRRILNSEWKPIFKKMMEAPGLEIPEQVTDDFIHVSFELATRFLKQQYSYIFKQPPDQLSAYKLGTWSKKIKRSEVEKYGTEEDKQKLPPPTAGNKKRARKESSVTTHRRKRRIPLKLK